MELGHNFLYSFTSIGHCLAWTGNRNHTIWARTALEQLGKDGGAWILALCCHFLALGSSVLSAIAAC